MEELFFAASLRELWLYTQIFFNQRNGPDCPHTWIKSCESFKAYDWMRLVYSFSYWLRYYFALIMDLKMCVLIVKYSLFTISACLSFVWYSLILASNFGLFHQCQIDINTKYTRSNTMKFIVLFIVISGLFDFLRDQSPWKVRIQCLMFNVFTTLSLDLD